MVLIPCHYLHLAADFPRGILLPSQCLVSRNGERKKNPAWAVAASLEGKGAAGRSERVSPLKTFCWWWHLLGVSVFPFLESIMKLKLECVPSANNNKQLCQQTSCWNLGRLKEKRRSWNKVGKGFVEVLEGVPGPPIAAPVLWGHPLGHLFPFGL